MTPTRRSCAIIGTLTIEQGALTVLVVDDDPDLRDAIASLLEDVGHRVLTASNGLEAIRKLRETRPSVVLLDLMMPESDGYDFRRRQLADPTLADIPVVAMTASGRAEGRIDEIAPAAFVREPFEFDGLLEILHRAAK
jgi:CheY-like chemotaxis protein